MYPSQLKNIFFSTYLLFEFIIIDKKELLKLTPKLNKIYFKNDITK